MSAPATKPFAPRWIPLAAAAILLIAAGAFIGTLIRPEANAPPVTQTPPPVTQAATGEPSSAPAKARIEAARPEHPPQPAAAASEGKPSFDVVRVTPGGNAVIAGRAFPGSHVVVRDGSRPIGEAQADANGAWVIVPDAPLPAGSHKLTVLATPLQGGPGIAGSGSVVVAVAGNPGSSNPGQPNIPLAVATGPGATRVLQGGGTAKPGELGIQALDYDQQGRVRLSGTAPAGATVQVYAGGRLLGRVTAGQDGRWDLVPKIALAPGQHVLRLDQLGGGARVTKRIEVPFEQQDFARRSLPPGSVVVQPGQSLWRIAEASYGAGVRYTLIFGANRGEIRNPNLIYPGQVIAVPKSAARLEGAGPGRR